MGDVRLRTTLGAALVVAVALTAAGIAMVQVLRSSLTDDIDAAARLRAEDVAALVASGAALDDLGPADDDEAFVQVLDDGGRVVAQSANLDADVAVADAAPGRVVTVGAVDIDGEVETDGYRVATVRAGDVDVLAGRSLELVDESTSTVVSMLAVGIPVLVLLVGAVAWAVTGRALRPVEAIRTEVEAIGLAALDRRVPEPPGDDEIARLARTMNAMLARLDEAVARQRRFVSDASHELRNPIATIRHQVEIAVRDQRLDADVLADTARLEGLVDDLLLLARLDEAGPGRRTPVDLDDVVLEELRRSSVEVDGSAVSAGRVVGDRTHLTRLVRNLLDNAARHARSRVAVSLAETDGAVRLVVEDDGPGVSAADRERVFERFARLDDARARDAGGAGLGLAIVREVAVAHGGTVTVDGSRFEVVLPAAP